MFHLIVTTRGVDKWTGNPDVLSHFKEKMDDATYQVYYQASLDIREKVLYISHETSPDPDISYITGILLENKEKFDFVIDRYNTAKSDPVIQNFYPNVNLEFEWTEID